MELIYLLIGLLAGGFGAWFFARQQAQKGQTPLRDELSNVQNELRFAQDKLSDREEALRQNEEKLEQLRQEHREVHSQLSRSQTEHKNLKEKLDEQKAELEKLNEKFAVEFKNLANEIFEEKSRKFTTQNKENLGELLNPLREKIGEFQKKVEDSHTAGEKRGAALGEQLKSLRDLNQQITQEAKNLTLALRGDSKTQGNWGEMQLEGILEKAGLQKDLHFFKEKNYKTEEGANQRLDFIINLPDGKNLVLDSKVSLSAYSRYFEAEDESEKARYLKEHLNSIYGHIKTLGDKNYQNLHGIGSPDYVMMFIANEPALHLALREDPELYDKALARNIVLVGTTTLFATLRTISYIWKQDLQNKNAEEIARQAGALYDKFVGFTENMKAIGKQIDRSKEIYEDAYKKLTSGRDNLVRKTEKLKSLGAPSSKNIDYQILQDSENEEVNRKVD